VADSAGWLEPRDALPESWPYEGVALAASAERLPAENAGLRSSRPLGAHGVSAEGVPSLVAETEADRMGLREATSADALAIVTLIRVLATEMDVVTPVDEAYVCDFLASPGSGILVADDAGRVVGLLSYSIRPSLVHAGRSCVIEELVVDQTTQRQRIGTQLVEDLLLRAAGWGCIEVSVTTLAGQRGAIQFYKARGFTDDAVFLEKHLGGGDEHAADSSPGPSEAPGA
jgi:GNAT superfamily N-acetyltransferase